MKPIILSAVFCICSLSGVPAEGGTVLAERIFSAEGESFEVPNAGGSAPEGWMYSGPKGAAERAWTRETPYDGSRALRLSGIEGGQGWTSDPIPVAGGKQYLLTWKARYRGEKIWRFRAEFSGIRVNAHFDAKSSETIAEVHTSCWQSPGWRPGWSLIRVPEGANQLSFLWSLDMHEPLPGGFDIDSMNLRPYPLEEVPSTQVSLRLNLVANGEPTVARIRIDPIDPVEAEIETPGCVVYGMAGNSFHPPADGICEVLLSPGKYRVAVTKGYEYTPWVREVDVREQAGQAVSLDVALRKQWDWKARGWISGDHHTHLYRHGSSLFTSLGWEDMPRIARAESLEFLPFMGADRYPGRSEDEVIGISADRYAIPLELLDEITEDFWGHVCPIGVSNSALDAPSYDTGPMNFDRWRAVEPDGGVLVYAHPYGPIESGSEFTPLADPESGLQAREFPIDLALGMPCGFDLLTQEGSANRLDLKLRDLYRLFNLGFRPTLTGSTDFHVDQGRMPIGSVRTYVLPDQPDARNIAEAYRLGRTFATNGPLLALSVNGLGPGHEFKVDSASSVVQVSAESVSLGRLDRLDIVVNGRVIKSIDANGESRISAEWDMPLRESSWIAARVYGPTCEWFTDKLEGRPIGAGQFAHTTPVFVEINDQPVRAASPGDAAYFVQWCDAVEEAWNVYVESDPAQADHDELVRERIGNARKHYARLEEEITARR